MMGKQGQRTVALLVIAGMVLSVGLATLVSLAASSSPDGLEKVAEDTGFADSAEDSAVADSPLADYNAAFVADDNAGVSIAGLLGVLLTAVIGFGLFMLLRARKKDESLQ